jgi:hypothetical protein
MTATLPQIDPDKFASALIQRIRAIGEIRNYVHGVTSANTDWEKEHTFAHHRCLVYGVACANKGGAGFWLWVCDGPVSLSPTFAPVYVPALSTQAIDWSLTPRRFNNGLYVCASTDPVTKTAPATNDAFFEATYEPIGN